VLKLPRDREGVLPNQLLSDAISDGVISADSEIPGPNLQPASLDLRLGEVAYRIRCSFLPDTELVDRKAKAFIEDTHSLTGEGVLLEPERPYLIPLKERLHLPPNVRAKANPKSSTGRIDVFTRVREDLTLNQLRLSVGRAALTDDEVRAHHDQEPLLYSRAGIPIPTDELALSNGMFLGLDLHGDRDGRVGYRAREHAPGLDLTKDGAVPPGPYWEEVRHEEADRVVLSPRKFYLLMSNEAVSIPPGLAAEMTAYDPTSGELRTHYAGFFDPGFGFARDGVTSGARAALEVRAHDVPFSIENGQRVCKLTFERMLAEPTICYGDSGTGSSYQRQADALGKHFLRSMPEGKTQARVPMNELPFQVDE